MSNMHARSSITLRVSLEGADAKQSSAKQITRVKKALKNRACTVNTASNPETYWYTRAQKQTPITFWMISLTCSMMLVCYATSKYWRESPMSKPRVWASITLGGSLPQALLQTLIEMVDYQIGSSEEAHNLVTMSIMSNKSVEFEEEEVAYGQFQDLEEFCMNHGLYFIRTNKGDGCDVEAGVVWYDPLEGVLHGQSLDGEGTIVVGIDVIKDMYAAIDKVLSKDLPADIPLLINDEDEVVQAFAKDILTRSSVDAYTFSRDYLIKLKCGPNMTIPPLKLI